MSILTRIFWAAFGVLQFVLAAPIMGDSLAVAVVFAVGGVLLLLAVWRRSTGAILLGTVCALLGPILVAVAGIEEFQPIHHVVRWAVVAAFLLLWMRLVRRPAAA